MEATTLSEALDGVRLDLSTGDEPLVDSVYRSLRDAIIAGRLEPNRKLAQIPLAEHLGISRTPVRDALQRLAQEGLVRTVSWRGFVVSAFSARDVLDIYQIRLGLEPLAVEEALGVGYSRLLIAQLMDNCEETAAKKGDEVGPLYDLNRQFHLMLVEPCPNRVMVRMLDQLWHMPASLRLFHAQAMMADALKQSAVEHREIVEAIEADERKRVLQLVRAHIQEAQQQTIRALEGDKRSD
jgi:DNA-binding GntR family transcriptional regulator